MPSSNTIFIITQQTGNARLTAPPTGTFWGGNSLSYSLLKLKAKIITLAKRYVQRAFVSTKPNSIAMIATADTQTNIISDGQ